MEVRAVEFIKKGQELSVQVRNGADNDSKSVSVSSTTVEGLIEV